MQPTPPRLKAELQTVDAPLPCSTQIQSLARPPIQNGSPDRSTTARRHHDHFPRNPWFNQSMRTVHNETQRFNPDRRSPDQGRVEDPTTTCFPKAFRRDQPNCDQGIEHQSPNNLRCPNRAKTRKQHHLNQKHNSQCRPQMSEVPRALGTQMRDTHTWHRSSFTAALFSIHHQAVRMQVVPPARTSPQLTNTHLYSPMVAT